MEGVVSVESFIARLKQEGLVIVSEDHVIAAERARKERAQRLLLKQKRFITYREIVSANLWNVTTVKGVRAIVHKFLKEGEDYIVSMNGKRPITKIMLPAVERIMINRGISW